MTIAGYLQNISSSRISLMDAPGLTPLSPASSIHPALALALHPVGTSSAAATEAPRLGGDSQPHATPGNLYWPPTAPPVGLPPPGAQPLRAPGLQAMSTAMGPPPAQQQYPAPWTTPTHLTGHHTTPAAPTTWPAAAACAPQGPPGPVPAHHRTHSVHASETPRRGVPERVPAPDVASHAA